MTPATAFSRSALRQALGLATGIDHLELDSILDAHFKSSATSGDATNVKRYPGEGPVALICKWDPTLTRISSIEAGPVLTPEDVEHLAELVARTRSEEQRGVAGKYMFLRGEHRWQWSMPGRMQLFTAPPEGESRTPIWTETPLVLQVAYRRSSISDVDWLRSSREVHFWAWTLALLIRHSWRVEDRVSRHHWVRFPGDPDQVVFAQEHAFGAVPLRAQDFYALEGIPPALRVPTREYFSSVTPSTFGLPADLEELIALVDLLDPEDRARLGAAGYWVDHARSVRSINPAAEFAALVTATESLIGPGSASATQRFIEFFAGGDGSREVTSWLRDLYDARSRIVHGWDFVPSTGRLFEEPRGFALSTRTRQMQALLPLAVRRWLAIRARES
jgi:hypothetical protein